MTKTVLLGLVLLLCGVASAEYVPAGVAEQARVLSARVLGRKLEAVKQIFLESERPLADQALDEFYDNKATIENVVENREPNSPELARLCVLVVIFYDNQEPLPSKVEDAIAGRWERIEHALAVINKNAGGAR